MLPEKKEAVSTPLLEYIRNKRAERQRIRDEKREEKRKKDLERRKAKEEQKKIKKDEDSVVVKVIIVNNRMAVLIVSFSLQLLLNTFAAKKKNIYM